LLNETGELDHVELTELRLGSTDVTLLVSSHVLAEIEWLCDRVAIMDGGRVLETGTVADLRAATGEAVTVTAHLVDAGTIEDATDAAAAADAVRSVSREGSRRLRLTCDRGAAYDVLSLLRERAALDGFEVCEPGLEATFDDLLDGQGAVDTADTDDVGSTGAGHGGDGDPEHEPPSAATNADRAADGGTTHATREEQGAGGDAESRPTIEGEAAESAPLVDRLRRGGRQVQLLAAREYRIAVRARWVLGLALLFGAFSVAMIGLGLSAVGPTRVASLIASLTQLAMYLVPLAGLVVGFDAVVGADERGSLNTVLALPVSAARVVCGKFLGRAAALVAATLIGFAFGGALLVGVAGVDVLRIYARFVLAALGAEVAFLAVSVLVSSLAAERTHALGGVMLVWVWFVLLHDLLALGLIAAVSLPESATAAVVLANPADVFRVLVLRGLPAGGGGLAAVLSTTPLSMPVLIVALCAWVVVPMMVATVVVGRRQV
jgi:Cu-processing system permease protein